MHSETRRQPVSIQKLLSVGPLQQFRVPEKSDTGFLKLCVSVMLTVVFLSPITKIYMRMKMMPRWTG